MGRHRPGHGHVDTTSMKPLFFATNWHESSCVRPRGNAALRAYSGIWICSLSLGGIPPNTSPLEPSSGLLGIAKRACWPLWTNLVAQNGSRSATKPLGRDEKQAAIYRGLPVNVSYAVNARYATHESLSSLPLYTLAPRKSKP